MIALGPAGTDGDSLNGVRIMKERGFDIVEIQFSHGVKMSNELAKKIGEIAKKIHLELSVHAPFALNLASEDMEKRKASVKRILDSCERAHYLGAKYIVFHAAYYGKYHPEDCYQIVKAAILEMQNYLEKKGWKNVILAPETTGRTAQFGTLDELLRLKKETGCHLTVDFAHIYARNAGKIDYDEVFEKLKGIKHIHAHFTGIEYGNGGERTHLNLTESFFKPLATQLMKRNVDISIISESPITWKDSLKMKSILNKMKVKAN